MFSLEFIVPAILLGIVCGINFRFQQFQQPSQYFSVWGIQSLIYGLVIWIEFWSFQPSITSPYSTIWFNLFLFWIINLIITGATKQEFPSAGATIFIVFFIIWIIIGMTGSRMFRADDYKNLIGTVKEKNWAKDIAPVNESHIRIVSQEQSQYLADKVIGESKDILGSRYSVGNVNVCNVNGEILWVAPLEFLDFWKWTVYKTTPGYIMVSAEDNIRKPILVDTLHLKYTESAFWGSDLQRYVYTHGYAGYKLFEISFELDDNYKPFYTISAVKPTIGFSGLKTELVIVVDPQNGEIKSYEPGKAPKWIDRIIPEQVAESYMDYWGEYTHGWWNTIFIRKDIVKPTPYSDGANVWFVPGVNGENYWYTGITSFSDTDQSLVGVMLMDTKNGETFYYRLSGSNEEAIVGAVNQKLGANGDNWHATQPVPYNIYGELSFVVPVVGRDKPLLQKIAIVKASNLNIVMGDDKISALREYQRNFTADGNIAAATHQKLEKQISGKVIRKGFEMQGTTTTFFLLLDTNPSKLFSVDSNANPEILITQIGDAVKMSYIDTDEEIVHADIFDLSGVDLKKSKNQQQYEKDIAKSDASARVVEQTRDDKKEVENLSPEELHKLLELKNKK